MNIKRDKTYQARMDGLKYALEIVERGGIEELKKEIRVRNAQFIPLEVSAKKANEISQVLAHRILATFTPSNTGVWLSGHIERSCCQNRTVAESV